MRTHCVTPSRVILCHLTAAGQHSVGVTGGTTGAIYPSTMLSLCPGVSSAFQLPLFLFESAEPLPLPFSVFRTLRITKSSAPLPLPLGICLPVCVIEGSAPLAPPFGLCLPFCVIEGSAPLPFSLPSPLSLPLGLCLVLGSAPLAVSFGIS